MVAALVVRFARFDLAQVGYDESAAASLVLDWRLTGAFPLTGIISSVGIPNPPAWPYLMAPVLLLWPNPTALALEGAAVGVLSVVLTWWIGRRWLGPWAGLAAGAVYGFGFWSALLGRSPWQPAFLQLPALLCLDALLMLGVTRRPNALVLAAAWLGVMVQLHYIALVYALLVIGVAVTRRDVLKPRHLVAAGLGLVLPLLPFLVYELHPSVRLHDVGFLVQQGGGSRVDLSAWELLWTLAGNGGAAGLGGASFDGLRAALGRWSSLGLLGDALRAGGLVVGLFEGSRGRIIAAWVLLPTVVLVRHTLDVLFHYLYIDLPGVALCSGMLVAWGVQRRHVAVRAAVGVATAGYAAVSIATLVVVLGFVETHDVYLGYGMPLRYSSAAAEPARSAAPPGATIGIGGPRFQTEVLRFAIGYAIPATRFEQCPSAREAADVYLLLDADSPAAAALQRAGAPTLARVARPGGAYALLGRPTAAVAC